MPIANFEHPIDFYSDNLSLEDWLANFYVKVEQVRVETPPCTPTLPPTPVASALFLPTELGDLLVSRAMLIDMFSEYAVREQEQNVGFAFLDDLS